MLSKFTFLKNFQFPQMSSIANVFSSIAKKMKRYMPLKDHCINACNTAFLM